MNEYEVKYRTLMGMLEKLIKPGSTYCDIESIINLIEVFREMEGIKENGTN